jgi:hypothetical protein
MKGVNGQQELTSAAENGFDVLRRQPRQIRLQSTVEHAHVSVVIERDMRANSQTKPKLRLPKTTGSHKVIWR